MPIKLDMQVKEIKSYINRVFCSADVVRANSGNRSSMPWYARDRAKANYEHNAKLTKYGPGQFIHAQSDLANYKMGDTTSDKMGCGWVATYNALIILGTYATPANLIYEFEMKGLVGGGILASQVKQYFNEHGYSVKSHMILNSNLDSLIRGCRVMILAFGWYNLSKLEYGFHMVAITYDSNKGKFLIYNETGYNLSGPKEEASMDVWWARTGSVYITSMTIS